MEPNLAELRAQGDQALFTFLKADLDISLTYVRLFQTERQLHDEVGSEQARLNAEKAIETVIYFRHRLNNSDQVREIEMRLAELERLVSALSEKS